MLYIIISLYDFIYFAFDHANIWAPGIVKDEHGATMAPMINKRIAGMAWALAVRQRWSREYWTSSLEGRSVASGAASGIPG